MIADPDRHTPFPRMAEEIEKRTLAGLHVEEAICAGW